MRLGLYGLPSAGKSFILDKIEYIKVIEGSTTMKRLFPEFDDTDEVGKEGIRMKFAKWLRGEDDFIMDGHYAFGNRVVFTEEDGELYDTFFYLYVEPEVLWARMQASEKNRKYVRFNIEEWQRFEIEQLRKYCHEHDKDFFVIDNPSIGYMEDISGVIEFIKAVYDGYSCVEFAKNCAANILQNEAEERKITLVDGDKTITVKDTSKIVYDYTTDIFDNNFYTGYQMWRSNKSINENRVKRELLWGLNDILTLEANDFVVDKLDGHSYILTSGDGVIWEQLSRRFNISCIYGNQMSADTKYFVVKFLRQAGKQVVAYGDSMNDYYMLREADEGYLIAKSDGSISRSLRNIDLGGIEIVRTGENR